MRKKVQFSVFLLCMSSIILLLIHNSTDDTIQNEVQDLSNEQMLKCPIEKKLKGRNEALVALATFPGSGTTWIRYLIEESTGCFTGTIYNRDDEHFMGGNIEDGKAVVIKTHFIYKEIFHQNDPGMLNNLNHHPSMVEFGRAIILMRHPRESIIAETNRHFTDDPKGFLDKALDDPEVIAFQSQLAKRWPRFIEGWLRNFARPKLVLLYEDLAINKMKIIHTIAEFLSKPVLKNGLECIEEFPDGYAKRNKTLHRPTTLHPAVERLIGNGLRATFKTRRMFGIDYSI